MEWPNQHKRMQKVRRKVKEFVSTNDIPDAAQLKKIPGLIFWKKIYGKYLCLIKNF